MEVNVNITGYRQLTQEEQDTINQIKAMETQLAELIRHARRMNGDPFVLAKAREHLQIGLFWMVRAIAKPDSPLDAA